MNNELETLYYNYNKIIWISDKKSLRLYCKLTPFSKNLFFTKIMEKFYEKVFKCIWLFGYLAMTVPAVAQEGEPYLDPTFIKAEYCQPVEQYITSEWPVTQPDNPCPCICAEMIAFKESDYINGYQFTYNVSTVGMLQQSPGGNPPNFPSAVPSAMRNSFQRLSLQVNSCGDEAIGYIRFIFPTDPSFDETTYIFNAWSPATYSGTLSGADFTMYLALDKCESFTFKLDFFGALFNDPAQRQVDATYGNPISGIITVIFYTSNMAEICRLEKNFSNDTPIPKIAIGNTSEDGLVNLDQKTFEIGEKVTCSIYNNLGELINTGLISYSNKLDISKFVLKKGIYNIVLTNGELVERYRILKE